MINLDPNQLPLRIKCGDNIAQMVIIKIHTGDIVEVDNLDWINR